MENEFKRHVDSLGLGDDQRGRPKEKRRGEVTDDQLLSQQRLSRRECISITKSPSRDEFLEIFE